MTSIAAIVLTYNRVELLKACLAAIGRQTSPCQQVIVVNNGSTDGTAAFLAGKRRCSVVTIEQNCGPAAGFAAAFQAGVQSGADLLWLMDDDVIPAPTALTELLRGRELLQSSQIDAPFLLSVARSPDGKVTNVPDLDIRNKVHGYSQWPALLHEGLVPIRRGTFVSALFPRQTVVREGLPLAQMYMWGEDTEYTLRVSRRQSGWLVGQSQVDHLRAQPGLLDIRTEPDPARVAMHRVHTRNLIYSSRKHLSHKRGVHAVLRVVKLAASLLATGEFRRAGIIINGLVAGLVFRPRIVRGDALAPAGRKRAAPAAGTTPIAAIGDK